VAEGANGPVTKEAEEFSWLKTSLLSLTFTLMQAV